MEKAAEVGPIINVCDWLANTRLHYNALWFLQLSQPRSCLVGPRPRQVADFEGVLEAPIVLG